MVRPLVRLTFAALALCALNAAAALSRPAFAQVCTPPPSGMVAWYPGDGNADDFSSTRNNAMLVGNATFAPGKVKQAFSLNGIDSFVQAPNNPATEPTTAGSQDAWVFFNQLPGTAPAGIMEIIGGGGFAANFDLQAEADNRFHFYVGNGPQAISTTTIQTGVWYHVVATWDSAAGQPTSGLRMYVNGVLENTNPTLTTRVADSDPLLLGAHPVFAGRLFNGLIDEAEVFNRALTDTEVAAIFNAGSAGKCKPLCVAPPAGLVSWIPGDNHPNDIQRGVFADNVVGNTFAQGEVAQAMSFDGVDDYVEFNDAPALDSTTATWDFWVRTTQSGVNAGILGKHDATGSTHGVTIYIAADGRLSVQIKDNDPLTFGSVTSANPINDGLFHHVAVTFQAGGALTLYIDGAVSGTPGTTPNFTFNATPLRIGRMLDTSWSPFNGQVDEVEIFNRVLSQADIQTIVGAQNAGKCKAGQNAGDVVISEFRFRGPNGDFDEFYELYNATSSPVAPLDEFSTSSISSGWTLASTNGKTFPIHSGVLIPARGHYLVGIAQGSTSATPGYSLSAYAPLNVNQFTATHIPDDGGIALFRTASATNFNTTTRLDAVGFSAVSDTLYKEGGGLSLAPVTTNAEHSYVRRLTTGVAQDTGDNAQDFVLVATDPAATGVAGTILGAPGPERSNSPIQRNATIKATVTDGGCSGTSTGPDNLTTCARNRNLVPDPANNSDQGTLSLRRTFKNNTGLPITRLRFRVVDITTAPAAGGIADLRVRTSADYSAACIGAGGGCSAPGQIITINGTTLEQPPNQPNGGGLNSSLAVGTITLAQPLAAGAGVNVQFLLGIKQGGAYRFFVNVEADTNPATGGTQPPVSKRNATKTSARRQQR